jgi:hypothetical protein
VHDHETSKSSYGQEGLGWHRYSALTACTCPISRVPAFQSPKGRCSPGPDIAEFSARHQLNFETGRITIAFITVINQAP